ncbi:hypothetical protein BJV74DRAFT_284444 [Russula compacta]|nr:hypothetical protein BJV74DRAFT_284444 [Russula compacta]
MFSLLAASLDMTKFCDLPLEIHLDIIDWSLEPPGHSRSRHRFLQLNSLSLVCKYLHRAVAPKIFQKYRLQLREACKDPGHDPRCFLTSTSLLTWNKDGFAARLAHLREKATFVRELRIVDHGQPVGSHTDVGGANKPTPFDSTLVPALLEVLNMLNGVVSVAFEGTKLFPASVHFPGHCGTGCHGCGPRRCLSTETLYSPPRSSLCLAFNPCLFLWVLKRPR